MKLQDWVQFAQKNGSKGVMTPEEIKLSGLGKRLKESPEEVWTRGQLFGFLKDADVRADKGGLKEVRTEDSGDVANSERVVWREKNFPTTDLERAGLRVGNMDRVFPDNSHAWRFQNYSTDSTETLFDTTETPQANYTLDAREEGLEVDGEEVYTLGMTLSPEIDFGDWILQLEYSEIEALTSESERDGLQDTYGGDFDSDQLNDMLLQAIEDNEAVKSVWSRRYVENVDSDVFISLLDTFGDPLIDEQQHPLNVKGIQYEGVEEAIKGIRKRLPRPTTELDPSLTFKPAKGAVEESNPRNMGANYRNFTTPRDQDVEGKFQDYRSILLKTDKYGKEHIGPYSDSHWENNDTVAFARLSSKHIDGKPAVFIEEMQSDWDAQTRDRHYDPDTDEYVSRKKDPSGKTVTEREKRDVGYNVAGNQRMPFANWTPLMAKRLVTEAIEKGVTRIAWTNPEQQSSLYNKEISRNAENLTVKNTGTKDENGNTLYNMTFNNEGGGGGSHKEVLNVDGLASYMGRGVAEDLARKADDWKADGNEGAYEPTTEDAAYLPTGEGMKHQYQVAIPKAFEEILRPYLGKKGAKAKKGGKITGKEGEAAHTGDLYTIGNEARESIRKLKTSGIAEVDLTEIGRPVKAYGDGSGDLDLGALQSELRDVSKKEERLPLTLRKFLQVSGTYSKTINELKYARKRRKVSISEGEAVARLPENLKEREVKLREMKDRVKALEVERKEIKDRYHRDTEAWTELEKTPPDRYPFAKNLTYLLNKEEKLDSTDIKRAYYKALKSPENKGLAEILGKITAHVESPVFFDPIGGRFFHIPSNTADTKPSVRVIRPPDAVVFLEDYWQKSSSKIVDNETMTDADRVKAFKELEDRINKDEDFIKAKERATKVARAEGDGMVDKLRSYDRMEVRIDEIGGIDYVNTPQPKSLSGREMHALRTGQTKEEVNRLDDKLAKVNGEFHEISNKLSSPDGQKVSREIREAIKKIAEEIAAEQEVPFPVSLEAIEKDIDRVQGQQYIDLPEDLVKDVKKEGLSKYNLKKEMIPIHNTKEEYLDHLFEGLVSPSIAVTRRGVPHTGFGDISLIMDKDVVDPKKRGSRTYPRDIYSPRMPERYYTKYTKDSVSQLERKLRKSKAMKLTDYIRLDDDLYDVSNEFPAYANAYAEEKGLETLDEPIRKPVKPFKEDSFEKDLWGMINDESKLENWQETVRELEKDEDVWEMLANDFARGKARDARLVAIENGSKVDEVAKIWREEKNRWMDSLNANPDALYNFLMNSDYKETIESAIANTKGVLGEVDTRATRDFFVMQGINDNVKEWVQSQLEVKSRTFRQWDERQERQVQRKATPANLLKYLRSFGDPRGQEWKGADLHTGHAMSNMVQPFKNMAQMRASQDQLITMDDAKRWEADDLTENLRQDVLDMLDPYFGDTVVDGEWTEKGRRTLKAIQDGVNEYSKSGRNPKKFFDTLNEWDLQIDWDEKDLDFSKVDKTLDLIQSYPTDYFESVPNRVVKPEEVAYAVVPEYLDKKHKERLKGEGIEVIEYKDQDERVALIDSIDDERVRFNLKKESNRRAKEIFDGRENPENSVSKYITGMARELGIVGKSREAIIAMASDPGTEKSEKVRAKAVRLQEALEEALDASPLVFDRQEDTIGQWISENEDRLDQIDMDDPDTVGPGLSMDHDEDALTGSFPGMAEDYESRGIKPVQAESLAKPGQPQVFTLEGLEYAVRNKGGFIDIALPGGGILTVDYDTEIYTDPKESTIAKLEEGKVSKEEYLAELDTVLEDLEVGSPEWDEAMVSMHYELQRDRQEMLLQSEKERQVKDARRAADEKANKIPQQTALELQADSKAQSGPDDILFQLDEETRKQRFYRNIVDRFDNVLRLEKEVKKGGGSIPTVSPYRAIELYPGRADEAIAKVNKTAEKTIQLMVKAKITPEEMSDFMYAQHAPERNKSMAVKNEGQESLSGMSDKEAAELIEGFKKSGKLKVMKAVYGMLRRERDRISQDMVDVGLRMEETQEGFDDAWDFYVPLKGIEDKVKESRGGSGKSKGFTAKENSKEALGRKSKAADNVMARYIADMSDHAVLIEKNKVGKAFLEMAEKNPNAAFWEIDPVRTKPKYSKEEQRVVQVPDPVSSRESNVYPVVDKNGEQRLIVFNTPEGKLLAESINGMDQESSNWVIQMSGRIQAFIGSLLTSYNPEFVVNNALRDAQTAAYNIFVEDSSKRAGRTVSGGFKAAYGIYRDQRGRFAGDWGKYWNEMQEAGGKTGFAAVPQVEEKLQELQELFDQEAAGPGQPVKYTKKHFRKFLTVVNDINDSVENALRLTYYRNLRESGKSKEEAASLAKNLTVNFNRKGAIGGDINKFFLFFNAAVQGTDRLVKSAKANPKKFAGLGAALTGIGFTLGVWNQLMGGEDEEAGVTYWEKIPDFAKSSNFIFMIPGGEGDHVKIPMPYGHNVLVNAGTRMADMTFNPRSNKTNQAFGMVNDVINATNPIGTNSLATSISPTLVRPIIELDRNQNFAGNPIYRKESGMTRGPTPNSELYFRSTAEPFKNISRAVNTLTGGSPEISGKVDIYPDAAEHLYEFMTGGTGKFFKKSYETFTNAMDKEFKPRKTPFVGKVFGEDNEYYDQSQFFNSNRQNKVSLQKGRLPVNRAMRKAKAAYKEFEGDIPDSLITTIETEADSLSKKNYGDVVVENVRYRLNSSVLPKIRKAIKLTKNPKTEEALQRGIMKFFNRVRAKISPLQSKLGDIEKVSSPQADKIRKKIDQLVAEELKKLEEAYAQ
jgi:hypothetical protein